MKTIALWTVAAAVVLFLAAVAVAPIVTSQQLIAAAKRGDAAGIERRVDFPALRDSLKDELETELARRVREDPRVRDKGLEGVAAMLAPMIVAGAVEVIVTPQTVAAMATSAEPPDPTEAPDPAPRREPGHDIHEAWGYRGLNQFAVTLTKAERPNQSLAFILERRGLFDWKLAAVDIQHQPGT